MRKTAALLVWMREEKKKKEEEGESASATEERARRWTDGRTELGRWLLVGRRRWAARRTASAVNAGSPP